MKALVYHGPGQRSWDDVPDPQIEERMTILDWRAAPLRVVALEDPGPARPHAACGFRAEITEVQVHS